jgi:hypothetical protein
MCLFSSKHFIYYYRFPSARQDFVCILQIEPRHMPYVLVRYSDGNRIYSTSDISLLDIAVMNFLELLESSYRLTIKKCDWAQPCYNRENTSSEAATKTACGVDNKWRIRRGN